MKPHKKIADFFAGTPISLVAEGKGPDGRGGGRRGAPQMRNNIIYIHTEQSGKEKENG